MTHRVSSSLRCRHCPLAGNGGGAVCGVWGGKEPRRRFRDGMNGSQDGVLRYYATITALILRQLSQRDQTR